MTQTVETIGRFASPNAQRYMAQLCKHFGHKVPVRVEGDRAEVEFQKGRAQMQATAEALVVTLATPDPEAIGFLRAVIDDHLVRFAFREAFTAMDWTDPVPAT